MTRAPLCPGEIGALGTTSGKMGSAFARLWRFWYRSEFGKRRWPRTFAEKIRSASYSRPQALNKSCIRLSERGLFLLPLGGDYAFSVQLVRVPQRLDEVGMRSTSGCTELVRYSLHERRATYSIGTNEKGESVQEIPPQTRPVMSICKRLLGKHHNQGHDFRAPTLSVR